jgi:hypothetical protein
MAIEGRDLQGTWRLVTGEALSRNVYKEVHGVPGKFAKDVEEEGKRLAREEERQHLVFEEHPLQPQRKREERNDPIVFEITQGRRAIFFSTAFPIYFSTTN